MNCAAAANVEVDVTEVSGAFDVFVMKRFNVYFLTKYVLCSVPAHINFCMEVGLMPKRRKCTYCKRDLKLVVEKTGSTLRSICGCASSIVHCHLSTTFLQHNV